MFLRSGILLDAHFSSRIKKFLEGIQFFHPVDVENRLGIIFTSKKRQGAFFFLKDKHRAFFTFKKGQGPAPYQKHKSTPQSYTEESLKLFDYFKRNFCSICCLVEARSKLKLNICNFFFTFLTLKKYSSYCLVYVTLNN